MARSKAYVGVQNVAPDGPVSGDTLRLRAGPACVTIAPKSGGRLEQLSLAGFDLLVTQDEASGDPLGWGVYPMAPWVGRVRRGRFSFEGERQALRCNLPPHAIHGTVYDQEWTVDDATDRTARLSCSLGPGWPYGGRAVQSIALDPHALRLVLEVHAGSRVMPASCGWHPWWRRDLLGGGALELDFDARARWERDEDGLPSGVIVPPGPRPPQGWDDCFTELGAPPVLRWPGLVELTMESDCEHLVVFDQPSHGLCVEPVTGPPNAFTVAPAIVAPGSPLVARTCWSWVLG